MIEPSRVAKPIAATMKTMLLVPPSPIMIPPKTPAAATIEPTDRSMPAVAMTNVIPMASTPITLAWVSMLRMLSIVGKVSGLRIEPTTNRPMTTSPSAYSCSVSDFMRPTSAAPPFGSWAWAAGVLM